MHNCIKTYNKKIFSAGTVALMPHTPYNDLYMKAVSDHVIQQEVTGQGVEPFTGDAASFCSWLGRMKENLNNFSMKPRAIINMLQ